MNNPTSPYVTYPDDTTLSNKQIIGRFAIIIISFVAVCTAVFFGLRYYFASHAREASVPAVPPKDVFIVDVQYRTVDYNERGDEIPGDWVDELTIAPGDEAVVAFFYANHTDHALENVKTFVELPNNLRLAEAPTRAQSDDRDEDNWLIDTNNDIIGSGFNLGSIEPYNSDDNAPKAYIALRVNATYATPEVDDDSDKIIIGIKIGDDEYYQAISLPVVEKTETTENAGSSPR